MKVMRKTSKVKKPSFKKDKNLSDYPKTFSLKDGRSIIVRPMIKQDAKKLFTFFNELPDEDKLFLRDDVSNKETINKWVKNLNYNRVLPLVALHKDEIVADATLHLSEYGWSRHVAEIRMVTSHKFRGVGVGAILARELYHQALKRGLEKIFVEMPSDQESTVKIFEKLGFEKEYTLKKHIQDLKGKKHDLLIMSNDVEVLWKKLESEISEKEEELSSVHYGEPTEGGG